MKYSQEIIRASLLGIKNSAVDLDIFPTQIQTHVDTSKVQEQQFLDALSLYTAYIQGGKELQKLPNMAQNIVTLPQEELSYCKEEIDDFLEQIIIYQRFSMDTFFNALIEKIEGSLLPLEYVVRFEKLTQKQLQAFGKRAIWLDSLNKQTSIESLNQKSDYLVFNKNERKEHLNLLLEKGNFDELQLFLEEIFEAETAPSKLSYIQTLYEYPFSLDLKVLQPIKDYIDATTSTTKSHQKISMLYKQMSFIHKVDRDKLQALYEQYFSKIWNKTFLKINLKEPEEVENLLQGMDAFEFENVDQAIEFIFTIVPVSWWCELLNWHVEQLLDYLFHMKSRYQKEHILTAMTTQIRREKNIELLQAFMKKQQQMRYIDYRYLTIIPQDEFIDFLIAHEQYLFHLEFHPAYVISYFKALRVAWGRELSKIFLQLVFHYSNYNQDLLKNIWAVAPYIDSATMEEIAKTVQEKRSEEVYDEVLVIVKMRELYLKL